MMENYEFTEMSSRNITENDVELRVVSFRGTDQTSIPDEQLNVSGSFKMPLMEYFMAGAEGRLSEVIKEYVVKRLTSKEGAE